MLSTEEKLDRAALSYLERFDSSASNLRSVLRRKAKVLIDEGESASAIDGIIQSLLTRYQASGLVNDARFAASRIRGLRSRGLGKRAILERLRAKGVDSSVVEAAFAEVDEPSGDPELEAARRYIKRRRLGPYRSGTPSGKQRTKDLQALGRAGFSFETARKALGQATHAEDDAC